MCKVCRQEPCNPHCPNAEASLSDLNDIVLEDSKITVVLHSDETRVKDDAHAYGILVEKASAYVQIEDEIICEDCLFDLNGFDLAERLGLTEFI